MKSLRLLPGLAAALALLAVLALAPQSPRTRRPPLTR